MKVRILTHHDVHNHGAVLQLYALVQILKKYDLDVCALDYTKNYDFLEEGANEKYSISIKSIPFYLDYLWRKGMKRTLYNIKKRRILERFKEKNHLVGEYYSRCEKLDAVFIGSDEVFSIETGLTPVLWGMGVPARHVFAYGACFGSTDISFIYKKHALEYIRGGIARFGKISVRDRNSQNIIKEISDNDISQVCDPVILYGFLDEKKNFQRFIDGKYLLVYAYDENMNERSEIESIKCFARKHNLMVVAVAFYHSWCDKNINVTPIELLSWVANAEAVVTDTFHGTVMSMVMNVQFAAKIRGNQHKLGFLLSEYGLLEREIHLFENLELIFDKKIDYGSVNEIMKRKRVEGNEYIYSCMEAVL